MYLSLVIVVAWIIQSIAHCRFSVFFYRMYQKDIRSFDKQTVLSNLYLVVTILNYFTGYLPVLIRCRRNSSSRIVIFFDLLLHSTQQSNIVEEISSTLFCINKIIVVATYFNCSETRTLQVHITHCPSEFGPEN